MITKLGFDKEEEKIEKALPGPCFHGEIYIICPNCLKALDAYSIKDTDDGIHECYRCGGKYYYKRYER
jgi:hypothetical protein